MTAFVLGIRLALKGSRTRIAVTGLALAFAVAFLLAVLGALPARQAKLDRIEARQPLFAGSMAAPAPATPNPEGLQLSSLYSWWRGERITGWEVVDAQPGDPLPPGVQRLPRPGELVLSPSLASAIRGVNGFELADRLPGRVVGQVGPLGLSGPQEYFAYVGVAKASTPYEPQTVARFGRVLHKAPVPPELRVAAQLGALGLLLPVLVLVGTATRLSAGARDRRLAAVRLVGGTPSQVGRLVAGEALVVGLVGSALGLLLFRALRPVAAGLVPVAGGVFPGDLAPSNGRLVLVLLTIPALVVAVSVLAMRRLVVDPLGVRRRGRRRGRAGLWRLVPLAAGLALLEVLRMRHRDFLGVDVVLLLTGGALTILGLAAVAPVVSRVAGAALVRTPGVAPRLAGRRLLADPSATARTLTGTVLVVFVGTWLLAFLPIVKVANGSDARSLQRLLPGATVFTHLGSPLSAEGQAELRALGGVKNVLVVGNVQLAKPGLVEVTQSTPGEDYPTQVAVVRCAELAGLLGRGLPCGDKKVFHVANLANGAYGPDPVGRRIVIGRDGKGAETVNVPAAQAVLDLGADAFSLLNGESVIDPSVFPPGATRALPGQLFVTTDGAPATTERVRNALLALGVDAPGTLDEQLAEEDRVVRGYERAARLGLLLAVLVGGVSLLVASIDAVRARRRDLAALAALGVPVPVLRRALLLEVLAPLLGCTGLALGCGAFAAAAYLSADTFYRDQVGLPWGAWGGVAGLAVLVVLAVTVLTLPLARGAARAEHLRAE